MQTFLCDVMLRTVTLVKTWLDIASTKHYRVYDSEASSSDISRVFSLTYSASDASHESMNSCGELEPCLYEPVVKNNESWNDTHDDDDLWCSSQSN